MFPMLQVSSTVVKFTNGKRLSFIVRKLPNIVWNSSELEKIEQREICISDRIDKLATIAKRYVSFDSWS